MAHETIFLTGFPGFIATRLVRQLAADGVRFQLLVQSAFLAQARQEVERIAAATGASAADFHIVPGDITQPDLGLSPDDLKSVRERATVLFHLAALYDLGVAPEPAHLVNVEGTRHVNALAQSLKNLRHYHYVSTCYVAGKRTGRIFETELEHDAGFRNNYEETKYLAELEVECLKGQLPITIHRPSVVCGDSRTGETAKYDGIYYLINYLRLQPNLLSFANIGNTQVRLNIVPVDFVVDAMRALYRDDSAVGATVQLADPDPPTTREMFDMIARQLAGRGSLLQIPPPLVRTTLGLPFSETFTGMPRVASPYFFIDQTYDTTRASALLSPLKVECPPLATYVENLVEFVARHPKL